MKSKSIYNGLTPTTMINIKIYTAYNKTFKFFLLLLDLGPNAPRKVTPENKKKTKMTKTALSLSSRAELNESVDTSTLAIVTKKI